MRDTHMKHRESHSVQIFARERSKDKINMYLNSLYTGNDEKPSMSVGLAKVLESNNWKYGEFN